MSDSGVIIDATMLPEGGRMASPGADVGRRIRNLREAAGLTQQQLADAIGLSRPAIAFWETGRAGSAGKRIKQLANALGVDERFLLSGSASEQVSLMVSADENDLISLYRLLDPATKVASQKWIERRAWTIALCDELNANKRIDPKDLD